MITQEQFQMLLQNPQMRQQQIQAFQQQMAQSMSQMNPMQQVQDKMANGQMSQEDFQRCRQMANMIMGVNY